LLCRRQSSLNEQCPKEYVGGFHGRWRGSKNAVNDSGQFRGPDVQDVPQS
jgi:hypothetical protein